LTFGNKMKTWAQIGICVALLTGCNPNGKIDENYRKSYDVLTEALDRCEEMARSGRTEKFADIIRKDPWGTPILIFIAKQSDDTILVAVAAGADCMHHTEDDVVLTRALPSDNKPAEQGVGGQPATPPRVVD
jgi:hypothetical protein